jgi:hypothetical protein
MEGETIVQLVTIIASTVTTIITLLIRARLVEQGKDIKELKAQAQVKEKTAP